MPTIKTVIDVHNEKLTMIVLGETVELKVVIYRSIFLLLFIHNALLSTLYIYLYLILLFREKLELIARSKDKWKKRQRRQLN